MPKAVPLQVISVSAFFISSNVLFRRFDLRVEFAIDDIELLIYRAKGKAKLASRAYAVSQRLAKHLDSMMIQRVAWDFDQFYYQIGLFSAEHAISPDGFLLTKKNMCDGALVCHCALSNSYDLTELGGCVDPLLLLKYEAIYLAENQLADIGALFGVNIVSSNEYYFELTPMLRSQADYYFEKHNLRLS